jgi:hypothetical protein
MNTFNSSSALLMRVSSTFTRELVTALILTAEEAGKGRRRGTHERGLTRQERAAYRIGTAHGNLTKAE